MNDRIRRESPLEVIDITRSAEGRTLIGRALRYKQRDVVTDDGFTTYVEMWLPGVFTQSLALRGDRIPLLGRHKIKDQWPFGVVRTWHDDEVALGFEAKVSRTRDGDELLELIQDRAVTGISVGAEPIRNNRTVDGVLQRVEAKLMELSVCVLPQISGAEILAVRERPADAVVPEGNPRLDAAREYLASLTPNT